jgi:hypothetical protein
MGATTEDPLTPVDRCEEACMGGDVLGCPQKQETVMIKGIVE